MSASAAPTGSCADVISTALNEPNHGEPIQKVTMEKFCANGIGLSGMSAVPEVPSPRRTTFAIGAATLLSQLIKTSKGWSLEKVPK